MMMWESWEGVYKKKKQWKMPYKEKDKKESVQEGIWKRGLLEKSKGNFNECKREMGSHFLGSFTFESLCNDGSCHLF